MCCWGKEYIMMHYIFSFHLKNTESSTTNFCFPQIFQTSDRLQWMYYFRQNPSTLSSYPVGFYPILFFSFKLAKSRPVLWLCTILSLWTIAIFQYWRHPLKRREWFQDTFTPVRRQHSETHGVTETLNGWGWQGLLTFEYLQRQRPDNLPGTPVPVSGLRWSLLCFKLCPWPLLLSLSTTGKSLSLPTARSEFFALPSLYIKCGCISFSSHNVFFLCLLHVISRELVSFQMLKI